MCDIDDDGERCEVWIETHRKAKKQHKCDACKGIIQPGETYLRHFDVFEGYVTNEKACAACESARKEFFDAHGGMYYQPSMFSEYLQNCVSDGDPESDEKWRPMLDALNARREAARA